MLDRITTSRRDFIKRSVAGAAASMAFAVPRRALADDDDKVAFIKDGNQFSFNTGKLKGVLRAEGKSKGLAPLVDIASDATVNRSLGIFSHYRLLETNNRYGRAAWDWASKAKVRCDGSVKANWEADEKHPFDMTAIYQWSKPDTLDVTTTVTARKDLKRFEVFLASYFSGFAKSWVYANGAEGTDAKPAFLEASRDKGVWHMFPRDDAAVEMIGDGRWKQQPHPVDWVIRPRLAGAAGMRRDKETGLTALVMAPPEDCFAVSTPYSGEGHRSLYLSLFGRDFKPGETATARSRLVVRPKVSDEDAVKVYQEYLKECGKGK